MSDLAWRQAAALELARPGTPPDEAAVDRLVRDLPEGIRHKPLYEPDRGAASWSGEPGAFPFVRGARAAGEPWLVGALHDVADVELAARSITEDVESGVDAIVISVDRAGRLGLDADAEIARPSVGDGGVALVVPGDVATLLRGVDLHTTAIWLDAGANALPFAAALLGLLDTRDVDPTRARIFTALDVGSSLALDGAHPRRWPALAAEAADLVKAWQKRKLGGRPLAASGRVVHEAGGHAAQELGFVLASVLELLRGLEREGIDLQRAAASIALEVAVGRDAFLDIAKLRALRLAWSKLVMACIGGGAARAGGAAGVPAPFVAVRTSARALSAVDPWANAVRGTTAAFSAALGGADLITVRGFDDPLGAPSAASRRLARHTQMVMRDESHLALVADPGAGSGYVEETTLELARAAWLELQRIEAAGGLLASLVQGSVQERIAAAAAERADAIARRKIIVVGANDFADPTEVPPPRVLRRSPEAAAGAAKRAAASRRAPPTIPDGAPLEIAGALVARGETFASTSQLLTVLAPGEAISCEGMPPARDAARFESLRGRLDALAARGGRPCALLAVLGAPAASRARVAFAQRAFEVSGYSVSTTAGTSPDEATSALQIVAAWRASGAPVVCLAGTDEDSAKMSEPAARALAAEPGAPIVLHAGKPAAPANLHAAGVVGWLVVGADAAALFDDLATRLERRLAPAVGPAIGAGETSR